HKNGLDEEAEIVLDEFDELANTFEGDPIFADIMERQFYAIRNVRTDTPAYDVKEYLRERLFSNDNPELFRTYLADLDFLLRVDDMKQAEKVAETWLEKWKLGIRQNKPEEFSQQVRIYHNIMLAYVDKVDQKLLGILDDAGDFRLEYAEDAEEVLFEIALERLEMSKYLVAAYRYAEAKTYLKTSYADLNLDGQETSPAAREIFLKDASLIAERITFAEQTLRGVASSIDEAGFKDYLSTQKRDEDLAERFSALMEETQQPNEEEEMIYPTVSDVSQQFTLSRIIVLDEDIETDSGLPFDFNILTARFLDRAKDGSSITFSARYDYSTNAVYDITLNDNSIRGSLAMDDFIRIAKEGVKEVEELTPETELDTESIADFLNLTESEEAERSQVIAQDLAKQLLLRELEGFKIFVSSTQQVVVLNPVTLNEFKVADVSIQDSEKDRNVIVDFRYSSVTKTLSNIIFKDKDVSASLPAQIKADEFISTVFSSLYAQEEEAKAVGDTISEFSKHNLLLTEDDILFVDGGQNQVEFKKVQMKSMPIEFAGVYYRPTETFLSAEHPLLTSQNVEVKEYLTQLSELFVIDYLASKGVTISQENITNPLPDPKVVIKNYVRADKVLDFTFNLSGNRLDKIKLQGTDVEVESMTFEEFNLIEGGEIGFGVQTQSQMDGNWSYITGSGIRSTPAIGNQGVIYIGSTDGKLYAFDPADGLKWSYSTEVIFETSPVVGNDGTIYIVGSNNELNGLYAVNPDGSEKWAFEIEGSLNFIKTGISLDADGTIYFGSYNKKLYAINPDGTEKWTFTIGENIKSTPAVKSGTIYFGGDKKLYAVNTDGTEKWTFEIGEKVEASPAVGSDGTIYIGSFDKKLYAVNPDGTEKWTFSAGDSGEDIIVSKPVIGSDGTIYFNSLVNLFALSPDGAKKWSFRPEGSIYSIPSIGLDGVIYFGSEDRNLYALDKNGNKKWSYAAKAKMTSSAVVGSDGTVYFGSEDRMFYAIKKPQDRSALLINEEGLEGKGESIDSQPDTDMEDVQDEETGDLKGSPKEEEDEGAVDDEGEGEEESGDGGKVYVPEEEPEE
ncbi:PQQ-binding-like beta-propeller repeat protein, partial [candidate division KSB1 bacterium]